MKKQLLIAAVAASMTSVAMADISITGKGMIKYTNTDYADSTADTNALGQEIDLTLVGKHGDTVVTTTIDQDAGTTAVWHSNVKTNIGPVEAQAGTYVSGANELKAKSTGVIKSVMTYDAGVAKIAYTNNSSGTGSEVAISGNAAGFDLAYAKKPTRDEFTASGSISGVNLKFHNWDADGANADMTFASISGTVSGITATYAQADADSSAQVEGDGFFGNVSSISTNGDDFAGFSLVTDVAGNTVEFKHFEQDSATATVDAKTNKFVVSRPLASGADLKVTYSELDVNNGTTGDKDTLEAKVTVAF